MIGLAALREFHDVLGTEGVITDPDLVTAAQTATFATTHSVPLILRPSSREEVQACVKVANRYGIAIYPVSTGKNWGYGSRVPAGDQCVLMELGRMNCIVDYSEKHGYVTVEPGVTQQQLYNFLAERGSKLIMDSTGASPECSVVANTVERGFGHTPYGDHFTNSCNFEVVLPNGDCIHTGHGRFGDAAAAPTYKWGIGAILDGLFSQSNFGIVTRMTVWLMPAPEYFQAFFFTCKDEASLSPVIDALQPLRLSGVLRSAAHIGNDYKVLAGLRQYPWERTDGETPLGPETMRALRSEMEFGAWNGSGALYGTKAQVAEARRLLKRALKGKVSRLQFLDDRMLGLADRFAGVAKWLTGWDLRSTLDLVRPIYGLMRGKPTDYALRSVYWRKRMAIPEKMDPDRDRCGLIWSAPVAPCSGDHAERISAIASETLLRYGFEPMLSITLLTERTLACVISISYDRDCPGEDERAMDCNQELVLRLTDEGYFFYRLGIQHMAQFEQNNSYTELCSRLKSTIDPNGILAPGRYQSAKISAAFTAR